MDQSAIKTDSSAPTIVEVDLGDRSYPIYIGSGLLDQPEILQRYALFRKSSKLISGNELFDVTLAFLPKSCFSPYLCWFFSKFTGMFMGREFL